MSDFFSNNSGVAALSGSFDQTGADGSSNFISASADVYGPESYSVSAQEFTFEDQVYQSQLSFSATATTGTGDISATAISNSDIVTGIDGDLLYINAFANGTQWLSTFDELTGLFTWTSGQADTSLAIGIDNSTLSLGDGDDNLSVDAWASGADPTAIGILDSSVQTGLGDDQLNVWASTSDSTTSDPAIGIQDSGIITDSGYDDINVSANADGTSSNLEATGLLGTSVDSETQPILSTGADSDSVYISASANGSQWNDIWNESTQSWEWTLQQADVSTAIGINNYSVDLGDGDDNLSVDAWASGADPTAIGVLNTKINAGSGHDTVVISSAIDQPDDSDRTGLAVKGSSIHLGTGDDKLTIRGDIENSQVYGGDGFDSASVYISSDSYQLSFITGSALNYYRLTYGARSLAIYSIEQLEINDQGPIFLEYSDIATEDSTQASPATSESSVSTPPSSSKSRTRKRRRVRESRNRARARR